jgi:hypothetical protein
MASQSRELKLKFRDTELGRCTWILAKHGTAQQPYAEGAVQDLKPISETDLALYCISNSSDTVVYVNCCLSSLPCFHFYDPHTKVLCVPPTPPSGIAYIQWGGDVCNARLWKFLLTSTTDSTEQARLVPLLWKHRPCKHCGGSHFDRRCVIPAIVTPSRRSYGSGVEHNKHSIKADIDGDIIMNEWTTCVYCLSVLRSDV